MKQMSLDKPVINWTRLDWEKVLYILIILVALTTRLGGVGDRVQSHDESIHTQYSWNLYTGRGFQHQPLMHGPFLFHATALSYFFFGDNDFSARLPVALMGVLVVVFPWLLRRWMGRTGALVASFFLLISPSIAYYSRYIRHDIPIILWSLIVIWAIFSYLSDGRERWLYLMAAGVSLMFATKEVSFIYNAIFGFFLVGLFTIQAVRQEWSSEQLKPLFLAALTVIVIGLLVLGLGVSLRSEEQPILVWWAISGGLLAGIALLIAVIFLLIGVWNNLFKYRTFDLVILLGTLCLPFLSPILIQVANFDPLDYSPPTLYYSGAITGIVMIVSSGIGLFWSWRRWGIAAIVYYAIFAILFTTIFTNGTGIASGLVGSLGYWLAQQAVERGSQPKYYYIVMTMLYEYLPLILTLIAPIYLFIREGVLSRSRISNSQSETEQTFPESKATYPILSHQSLFVVFLLWWTGTAWLGYSLAGERMPWLTVHLALPMILLSGWLIGQFIKGIHWQRLRNHRHIWLMILIVLPFIVAMVMLIKATIAGPFQGSELEQLNITEQFLAGLAGTLILGSGLGYLVHRSGWRIAARILLLMMLLTTVFLTIRTAWRFCYVNYDYPTEFLVYAHSAPAVHETMRQIDELSRRTVGGPNLIKVAYGAEASTLFYWQLRNYPNATFYGETPSREQMEAPVVIAGREQWDMVDPYLANDYVFDTYTYLWWPSEDYRNLTWGRITHAITDTQTRTALWDIWYNRDFARYDQVTGKTHTLDKWPLRSDYRLYIRRDLAAQVWEGNMSEPTDGLQLGPVDPYAESWQELSARLVFGSQGAELGQFERPNGIAIDPNGRFVYVADTGNHRIQKFTTDGQFVAAWGQNSTVETERGVAKGFNEPWDITLSPTGDIYIADTWNHRIQKLDDDGNPIAAWGLFGQYGLGDGAIGQSAFYGPRGIAIDSSGQIYVADTGNKRIQVFDSSNHFAFQWGGGGIVEGYLDEPVGIAAAPDHVPASAAGIYVADTWNRRVQVFDSSGTYLRQWSIAGWDVGLPDEKPYLAIDANGYVYVTDPGHYRVLVFDHLGNYILSFGQYGFDEQSFALPMGIAIADDGSIYIVDSQAARVLVFDPPNLFDPASVEP
ncbi:MAG: TIGR03663 family protein [Chloroflexi bacterium]|nr:TIGR03663 family protein [Chloroflexota bacterium]